MGPSGFPFYKVLFYNTAYALFLCVSLALNSIRTYKLPDVYFSILLARHGT
jgi:hypothetical protein